MGMDGGGSIQTQSIKNLEKGIVMKKNEGLYSRYNKDWEARMFLLNRIQAVTRGKVVLNAWHNYCMESWIFRLFVKLGLRK